MGMTPADRQRRHRRHKAGDHSLCGPQCHGVEVTELPLIEAPEGIPTRLPSTTQAVRAELLAAGRLDTYLGQAALSLAALIDSAHAVMGYAAMVKELRATMDEALAGVTVADDPLDELRAKRDKKLTG